MVSGHRAVKQGMEIHTLNSLARRESSSQCRASTTLACAVTDCGSRSRRPAACVRLCVAKKIASWRSDGSALNEAVRRYNWSIVASEFVMCAIVKTAGYALRLSWCALLRCLRMREAKLNVAFHQGT